ncbi:hypothetical protein PTH_2435 [Pelotomaculum thermopropionicum SI]|uniref:MutL protein n=1 Tax=Pelotomaculum thermopropionicum (strain DSM 13744 / JCM 10971 / SI) TaxID=370438 RepID=A5CZF3_PELTS|nr:hypothetical protein PTH_2435 [Pelotomaculum thermopropionicum SI]
MSDIRIFMDFGSTFTKVVAFDLDKEELVARVQAPSTVESDITIGLEEALKRLAEEVDFGEKEKKQALACSSAAGGLRVVCVGLVPEYTTEAARMAALGAGAKIVGTYSYELSKSEVAEIEETAPDIVLLTGGTDGGNKKVIIHNAKMLSEIKGGVKNIIVAGNKSAYDDIKEILIKTSKNIVYTKNVMSEIGVLNVDSANRAIRELFINRITEAKGIARVRSMINNVIMPTPSAVMEAAKLIAEGVAGCAGLGELLLVDVGGATTDVYSVAKGAPSRKEVSMIGLPQPYVKRTVEGDLGLFHNLDSLIEIASTEGAELIESLEEFEESVRLFHQIGKFPEGDKQIRSHLILSHLAVKTAVERHVGKIDIITTHNGDFMVQRGKDLTQLKLVIGTGGPVAFSPDPRYVLKGALFQKNSPNMLKPINPEMMLDEKYILFAIGLLAQSEPLKALKIIKKYLAKL